MQCECQAHDIWEIIYIMLSLSPPGKIKLTELFGEDQIFVWAVEILLFSWQRKYLIWANNGRYVAMCGGLRTVMSGDNDDNVL